jgi:hypothetical protein
LIGWKILDDKLLEKVDQVAGEAFNELHLPPKFIPGQTNIPVTGKVFGKEEISAVIKASNYESNIWKNRKTKCGNCQNLRRV